jgi:hypothetical protein
MEVLVFSQHLKKFLDFSESQPYSLLGNLVFVTGYELTDLGKYSLEVNNMLHHQNNFQF